MPSPQIGVQLLFGNEATKGHCQPVITERQSVPHPLLSSQLPSSHVSEPTIYPSPHIGTQIVGSVLLPPVQNQVERLPV